MLTSVINDYDPNWPAQFDVAARRLKPLFGDALIEMHHIGSTAVPGLAGKPEIDILAVLTQAVRQTDWSDPLDALGYRRGNDLSPGHQFYKRDANGIRTHKLHVCVNGHTQVARMIGFRDLLRADDELRTEYAILKRQLERSNTEGIKEYLTQKDLYIRAVMAQRCR